MKKTKGNAIGRGFENLSERITKFTGSSTAFTIALLLIITWAVTGPIFHYSETWQLVINTGTTIITFLMVFIIQKSQNRESMAIQLKLNELVAANPNTSNRMVSVETLSEEELEVLKKYYCSLSDLAKQEKDLYVSHTIEEAMENHSFKVAKKKKRLNSQPAQTLNKKEVINRKNHLKKEGS